ncbi:superoxide dismutase [Actinoplanes sp. NPDC026619]|uniref:superoxide dismutase n=1 Tax=Actinoplanes sp. NPDC026619 TaxID=3155798 RepID=UPI0033D94326
MLRRTFLSALGAGAGLAVIATAGPALADGPDVQYPPTIDLPPGVQPDSIVMLGRAPHAAVSSRHDGAIYRVDLQHGDVTQVRAGRPGRQARGLAVGRYGPLFVAGGAGRHMIEVLDSETGELLASYPRFHHRSDVNDVVAGTAAAWFIDGINPELYRLELGHDEPLPSAATRVRITGELRYRPGINANGLTSTPDGSAFLVVQAVTGNLYRVTDQGVSTQVDLGGEKVFGGDGLHLKDGTLYVAQPRHAQVTKIEIDAAGTAGQVVSRNRDPRFVAPAGITEHHNIFYVTNGRRPGPGSIESVGIR